MIQALQFLPMAMEMLSGKKSEYKPYQYAPVTDKKTGEKVFEPGMDQADLEASINSAANSVAKDQEDSQDKGYGDTSAWVGAAVNLLSNLEAERQRKQADLMAQRNSSANYGLTAMGQAGSALERLNRGRMGRMGLSSMAGV